MIRSRSYFTVKVDGQDIVGDMGFPVNSISLTESINDHCVLQVGCSMVFPGVEADQAFVGSSDIFGMLGKQIGVAFAGENVHFEPGEYHEFVGLITSVDVDNDINRMNQFTITAMDPSHVMAVTNTSAFYKETTALDIISQLLDKHGIPKGDLDLPNNKQIGFYFHNNESDYALMRRLASIGGSLIHYDGSKLNITPASSASPVTLQWGASLGALSVSTNCMPVKFKGSSYNYNESDKFEFEAQGDPSTSLSELADSALSQSKDMYPESAHIPLPEVFQDASDVSNELTAHQNSQIHQLVNAEGISNIPSVKAGRCISISDMPEVGGKYMIFSVTHYVGSSHEYYNNFQGVPIEAAYGEPMTLEKPAPESSIVTGVVVDTDDPEQAGRIQVTLNPSNVDENTEWARCASLSAGADHSFYFIPEIGDEVVIGFEDDDPSQPIVLGSLFNSNNMPNSEHIDPENDQKLLTTKSGNKISISDADGDETISIISKDEKALVTLLAGDEPSITIKTEGNMTLDAADITIKASGNLNIEVEGDITQTATGNINSESTGDTEIMATGNVKVNATQNLEQKATAQLSMAGTAGAELKGTKVDVTADTALSLTGNVNVKVTGGIINLN